jgi:prepilin-type N-terminal cleavage/methylation domain-containing protein
MSSLLHRRRPSARRVRARRGFTLVELMVAILLLGVGVLGMAGLSVVAGAQWRGATLQQKASQLVQSRIDSLTSLQCSTLAPSGPQSGTLTFAGVTEKWWVRDGNNIKSIIDTVRFRGRTQPLVYTTIIPCRN